jgi:DNA-directed RNA polymerase specialized sigma24 family protein
VSTHGEDPLVTLARIREINAELFEADHRAKWLRSERARLVERALESLTLQDIAAMTGVTRQRVHQWAQS